MNQPILRLLIRDLVQALHVIGVARSQMDNEQFRKLYIHSHAKQP